jgi:hypothetical protein
MKKYSGAALGNGYWPEQASPGPRALFRFEFEKMYVGKIVMTQAKIAGCQK